MDPSDVLSDKRPLFKEEVASIRTKIKKPESIDEVLFLSVVNNLMDSYTSQIVGVENRADVKKALMDREESEEVRYANLNLKLTQDMRYKANYPSARDGELPFYYKTDDIPSIIGDWARRIEKEALDVFQYSGEFVTETQIEEFFAEFSRGKYPKSYLPDVKARIISHRVTPDKLPFATNEIYRAMEVQAPRLLSKEKLLDVISEALTGDVRLTEKEIESIVSVIDYKEYFTVSNGRVIDDQVAQQSAINVKNNLRIQLSKAKVPRRHLDKVRNRIKERFQRSIILTGAWVGSNMASAFGEAATQQTLNTFHSAGDRKARTQITGFPKFKSIMDAVENPKTNVMIIFPKKIYNGEQIRLRIPQIQMTTLADLVEGHWVIPSQVEQEPMARWEKVHDAVHGIKYDVSYSGGHIRYNLHRYNPIFNTPTGRILRIKLKIQELYMRRISLSAVANAIEEASSEFRVTVSSMDIGLIHVYYKFDSLVKATRLLGGGGGGEAIPEFALADEFAFTLNKVVYPVVLQLQIGGIPGIEYTSVYYYNIVKAMEMASSTIDRNDPKVRINIPFTLESTFLWGITEEVLRHFFTTKLRRFIPRGHDIDFTYDAETGIASMNIGALRIYNYEKSEYRKMNLGDFDAALTKDTKFVLFDLLNRSHYLADETNPDAQPNPAGPDILLTGQASNREEVKEFQEIYMSSSVRLHPDDNGIVIVEFNHQILKDLGFDFKRISDTLEAAFSFDKEAPVTSVTDQDNGIIYLKGIVINPNISLVEDQRDLVSYVILLLKDIAIPSDRINQSAYRWYFNAEGKNFKAVLGHPDIDPYYTRTDNVVEVYRTLGVESCRSVLLHEISSCNDPKINRAHIELISDAMLYRTPGDKPIALNHHGMTKRGAEFISRMWERTSKVAMGAGLGQVDNLNSLPSLIITGNLKAASHLKEVDRREIFKEPTFYADFPQGETPVVVEENPVVTLNVVDTRPKTVGGERITAPTGTAVGKVGKTARPERTERTGKKTFAFKK